jgi:hypothetical protein
MLGQVQKHVLMQIESPTKEMEALLKEQYQKLSE